MGSTWQYAFLMCQSIGNSPGIFHQAVTVHGVAGGGGGQELTDRLCMVV